MKCRVVVTVLVAFVALGVHGQDGVDRREAGSGFRAEQILLNMPVNSDRRCLGISLVAAALLEGELIADDGFDVPEELGKRIYEAALTKERLRFHAKLRLDAAEQPIQSRESLDALATVVANRYKQRYQEFILTAEGIGRLRAAESSVVRSKVELDALLDADRDKIMAFPVTGERQFPDGSIMDTSHAILIAKTAAGEMVVYDSNDPGTPLSCRLRPSAEGLTIIWTCRYKNTGQTTTQSYLILHPEKALRLILARE